MSQAHLSHGELKREIARQIGSDIGRYRDEIGVERHKRLTDAEVTAICEQVGLGFLADESKQQRMDTVMIRLGRDHRTGTRMWDSSDLRAILEALRGESA